MVPKAGEEPSCTLPLAPSGTAPLSLHPAEGARHELAWGQCPLPGCPQREGSFLLRIPLSGCALEHPAPSGLSGEPCRASSSCLGRAIRIRVVPVPSEPRGVSAVPMERLWGQARNRLGSGGAASRGWELARLLAPPGWTGSRARGHSSALAVQLMRLRASLTLRSVLINISLLRRL